MMRVFLQLNSLRGLDLASPKIRRLKSLCENHQIFVGHGFSRAVTYAESMRLQPLAPSKSSSHTDSEARAT